MGDGPPWVHGLSSTLAGTSSQSLNFYLQEKDSFSEIELWKVFSWLRGLSYISGELGERNKSINTFLEFFINF